MKEIKSTYQCKEWMEEMRDFGKVQRDSHKWVEVMRTKELQTIKCEVCGKYSTARLNINYI